MPANLSLAVPAANVSVGSGDRRLTNHVAGTMYGVPVIADGDQVTAAGIIVGATGIYHIFTGGFWTVAASTYGAGYWKNGTMAARITSTVSTDRMGNFIRDVPLNAGDIIALNTYQAATRTLQASGDQTYIAVVRVG